MKDYSGMTKEELIGILQSKDKELEKLQLKADHFMLKFSKLLKDINKVVEDYKKL